MANTPLQINSLGNRFIDYRDPVLGDSYNWAFARSFNQIIKLAIHHSVTPQEGDWKKETDRIASEHVNGNGWAGIGYHFVIGSDGVVAYVGDILTGRANITANNEKIIGICLVGDFTKILPTDIQIHSAHDLCDFFINNYPQLNNVNSWDDLMGHKDAILVYNWPGATPTACPGSSWPTDMRERIKNNISTPQPVPQPPSVDYKALWEKDEQLIANAKNILYGKGYTWQKINNLKQLLPK